MNDRNMARGTGGRASVLGRGGSGRTGWALAALVGLWPVSGAVARAAQPGDAAGATPVEVTPGGAVDAGGRAALAAWSESAWRTAVSGDESAVVTAIHEAAPVALLGELGAEWLRTSIDSFAGNVAKRETDRAAAIEKVGAELDELMAAYAALAVATPERAVKISEAIAKAVELELVSSDKAGFFGDARVATLEADAVREAEAAESASRWLLANELYARLETLFVDRRGYERQSEALTRRLLMIQLYAPLRYWELRNERRVLDGAEPLAKYNAFGDGHEVRLEGITQSMVLNAVVDAGARQVDRVPLKEIVLSGLEGVLALGTTTDLSSVFPSIGDAAARAGFEAGVGQLRREVEASTRQDWGTTERLLRRINELNARTLKLPEQALLHEFGAGAMVALDDYSAIVWPDELAEFRRAIDGEFVGIGVQIQYDEHMNVKVVTPLEGTPAQRAGLRAEDVIVGVDGHDARGFTLKQAVDTITGAPGTRVSLTVEREVDGAKVEKQFEVERRAIRLPTVKGWVKTGPRDQDWDWMIDPEAGIGYVRLTGFSEETSADFDAAIAEMRRRPGGLNGLILDLRFNPGGLLEQAIEVSSRFVDAGLIVKTEDAQGVQQSSHAARRLPSAQRVSDVPLVVLINEGSASASEIVSGAIQAHAKELASRGESGRFRAVLIGANTFGKGSVQQVRPLDSKGRAMLKLTTQYYKLRTGEQIHRVPGAERWGVSPDLTVTMLPEQETKAILLRRDADLVLLDDQGAVMAQEKPADVSTLITEGLDLQLHAGLVLLQAQYAGQTLAMAKAAEPAVSR